MVHHHRLSNAYEVAESDAYALMRLPENQRAAFLIERKRYHYEQALKLTGDSRLAMNWANSVHAHTEAIVDVLAASREFESWARQLAPSRAKAEQPTVRDFLQKNDPARRTR